MQKTNQKKFGVKKVIKTKGDKLYVKWKGYDSSFNGWIDKKDINEWIFSKTEIFSRKSESWIRFNYATKENLKNATDVDTSDFTKKTDLANLKSDADKVDRTWQIARMVTSAHATCAQRGFRVHEITCTEIYQNTFK